MKYAGVLVNVEDWWRMNRSMKPLFMNFCWRMGCPKEVFPACGRVAPISMLLQRVTCFEKVGVVLGKGWANYELDGLVTRAVTGDQVLLPVWLNITKREVIDYSPSLADKLVRSTTAHTIEEIDSEIIGVIKDGE